MQADCGYLTEKKMQVTLKLRTSLPENVQKHRETFGYLPSIEAMNYLAPGNLAATAKQGRLKVEPISEWKDRAITKTGTRLDERL